MRQADLNRAVARATGETVGQVARRGFSLLVVPRSSEASSRRKICSHRSRGSSPLAGRRFRQLRFFLPEQVDQPCGFGGGGGELVGQLRQIRRNDSDRRVG